MIWGISCLQFCKKSADHKEGNTCSEVPKLAYVLGLSLEKNILISFTTWPWVHKKLSNFLGIFRLATTVL